MRNFKYILFIAASLFAACTAEIFEEPVNKYDGTVQIVGRVIPFADCDVDTRANKNDSEIAVNSVDYFIFNQDDICIFHGRMDNSDALSIDKKQISTNHGDISNCYIVTIANTNGYNVTEGSTTWATLEKQTEEVTGVEIPENGLPMFGRHPETSGYFNLSEVKSGQLLTVPMVSLYSKIVVNISVDADQVLSGENQPVPTFQLTGCEVHNVASGVDFIGGTESHDGANNGTDDKISVSSAPYAVDASGETLDGGTQISFSFYLPERFVKSNTSANVFTYPFGAGVNIREEDMNYRQRYKPMLAKGHAGYNTAYDESKDKKATYASISGIFSDHQGHSFNVSYDIYVGNDNYSNFDIVRNRQYNNNIIIQGISNSSDQSTNHGAISIDHRVNVERLEPIIVNFRRETLLDSHFEVRPLRIRKNPQYTGNLTNAKVKVEVEYAVNPTSNWIGLERSFGNGVAPTSSTTYLLEGELAENRKNSAGKRKYFTTDLTTNTLNTAAGKTVIVPVTEAEECIWIYVDECTTADDDVRTATIKVSYALDGTKYSEPVSYVINQRELFPVTYNGHTYHIEYHEEYLHNYDSEDQFGQTEYEGMAWGLNKQQLSNQYKAFFVEGSITDGIINAYASRANLFYDFYLTRDIDKANATKRDYNGWQFSTEVAAIVNNEYMIKNFQDGGWFGEDKTWYTPVGLNTDISDDLESLTLGTDARYAVEYCLNKNKRNADGSIITSTEANGMNSNIVYWYLPAIDEIEEIVMSEYIRGKDENGNNILSKTYARFDEFQEKYYWSSQPGFYRGYGIYQSRYLANETGDYYYDDIFSARSTKVAYLGNNRYDYVSSNIDGYEQIMDMYVPADEMFNPRDPIFTSVTNDKFSYTTQRGSTVEIAKKSDKTNHPGNDPRSQKNRIRCVRNYCFY